MAVPGETGNDEDFALIRLRPRSRKDSLLAREPDGSGIVDRKRGLDERPSAKSRVLGIAIRIAGADLTLAIQEHFAEAVVLVLDLR